MAPFACISTQWQLSFILTFTRNPRELESWFTRPPANFPRSSSGKVYMIIDCKRCYLSWSISNNDISTKKHFDYNNNEERQLASKFRDLELPFKLYNIPEIDRVRLLWTNDYLKSKLTAKHCHVEKSKTNHFMYWWVYIHVPFQFT